MAHETELVNNCDYETRLAIAAWVISNIWDHAQEGGSFRTLIYERLGFDSDAYVPLYEAGGMEITNNFDMTQQEEVIRVVQDHKIEVLKPALALCDEPGCFEPISCGFPVEGGGYRSTCYIHYEGSLKK